MASQSGYINAGQGISSELRARDLPSKRLLGKGLVSIGYETEWKGERFARKDFIGVPSGTFQKEAAALVRLKDHENVVKTHGWTVDKMSCSLVLEYLEDDLLGLLQKRKESQGSPAGTDPRNQSELSHTLPFELPEALDIILQISRGMEYLHEQEIVHGGLKTKNILVTHIDDRDKNLLLVKVSDFGLVRSKRKSMSFVSRQARKLDMVQWKAPEYLEMLLLEDKDETTSESDEECTGSPGVTDKLLFSADVYSFAVTCVQILTGEDPYPNLKWKELGAKIVSSELRPKLPAACPSLLSDLLVACWVKAPAQRPSFSSIRRALEYMHNPQMVCCTRTLQARAQSAFHLWLPQHTSTAMSSYVDPRLTLLNLSPVVTKPEDHTRRVVSYSDEMVASLNYSQLPLPWGRSTSPVSLEGILSSHRGVADVVVQEEAPSASNLKNMTLDRARSAFHLWLPQDTSTAMSSCVDPRRTLLKFRSPVVTKPEDDTRRVVSFSDKMVASSLNYSQLPPPWGRSTSPVSPEGILSSDCGVADDAVQEEAPSASNLKSKTLDRALDESEEIQFPGDGPSPKKQTAKKDMKGSKKRVRDPKYSIQTRSDVDIIEDGYQWSKYGQKSVKNSPYPRNYYRCRSLYCPVRKWVERNPDDPKLVTTTYSGTHAHLSPAAAAANAKNSSSAPLSEDLRSFTANFPSQPILERSQFLTSIQAQQQKISDVGQDSLTATISRSLSQSPAKGPALSFRSIVEYIEADRRRRKVPSTML